MKRDAVNTQTRKFAFSKRWFSLFVLSVLLITIGTALTGIFGTIIFQKFGNTLLPPPDLFFEAVGYHNTSTLADIIPSIMVLLLGFTIYKTKQYHIIPYVLLVLGITITARAFIIPLTPLAYTESWPSLLASIRVATYDGMFPSGHTAFVAIIMFFIAQTRKHLFTIVAFALFIGEILSMLLSQGHYSIDIVGGFLLAYFVFTMSEKYVKKHYVVSTQ